MKEIKCRNIMQALENGLSDLVIISQDFEYVNGQRNYHEIRAIYADQHLEIKVLNDEFVKVEMEKLGQAYLVKIMKVLQQEIDLPTLSYELINFEENENIVVLEWTNKDAAERYLEVLSEDVAAAGYYCNKVKVYKKNLKNKNN